MAICHLALLLDKTSQSRRSSSLIARTVDILSAYPTTPIMTQQTPNNCPQIFDSKPKYLSTNFCLKISCIYGELKPTHVNMGGEFHCPLYKMGKSLRAIVFACLFFIDLRGMLRSAPRQLSNRKIFAILCLRFSDFLVVFSPSSALRRSALLVLFFFFFCLSASFYLSLRQYETLLGVYYWQQ